MAKKDEVQTEEHFELAVQDTKELADWEDILRQKTAEQDAQRSALSTGPKFISFKGGHIGVDKVAVPGDALNVVVLSFIAENTWYKGKYDSTKTQSPVCYSVYRSAVEMIPSEASLQKQSDTCATCPKFKWGSDPLGGKGKACKTRIRIAVIPAPVKTEQDVLSAELRFATLPVTSGADFDSFMSKSKMLFQRPIFGVVAEVKVIPDATTQYKVLVNPVEHIEYNLLGAVLKRVNESEEAINYGYEFDEEEEVVASKKV